MIRDARSGVIFSDAIPAGMMIQNIRPFRSHGLIPSSLSHQLAERNLPVHRPGSNSPREGQTPIIELDREPVQRPF